MDKPESRGQKLWILFATFFKISTLTVGGGLAMLPIMEEEFVRTRKWVAEEDIVDVLALIQSVPGVIAVNAAVFVGYRVAGFLGALAAAFGVIIPAFTVIVLIATFMVRAGDIVWLGKCFLAIRAGVCALILLAAWAWRIKSSRGASSGLSPCPPLSPSIYLNSMPSG